jgi:signal transduction histidine kinase/CheY-like chemotaxis protein
MRPLYAQILFVWLVFSLMVLSSSILMMNNQQGHLVRRSESALSFVQTNIEADLAEPRTTLGSISETIRGMILRDEGKDQVFAYIKDITEYLLSGEGLVSDFIGAYGVFDAYDGLFYAGIGWIPPDDYVPQSRPWYTAALEAGDGIGVTQPYLDVSTFTIAITYARQILDDEGRPLGVICLDVALDRVRGYAANAFIDEGSYGILLNSQLEIIAHPNIALWGKSIYDLEGLEGVADELSQGRDISERRVQYNDGDESIVFFRSIANDWHMGIVTPASKYYQEVFYMALGLTLLGVVLAVLLTVILIRIDKAKQKSEQENRLKSTFLATVSHEIRTPMNAILGIAEIQLQDETLSPDTQEAFIKLHDAGYTLLHIINDMLDLSKIEAGKMDVKSVQYNVPNLIHDAVHLNILRLGSKPIDFKLEVDEAIPTDLYGDELRIKQILNNLLSNAFKYTEKGVITLAAAAEVNPDSPDVRLVLRVSDTGYGMTEEQVSRVFDAYTRFEPDTGRIADGIGLGMSIVQRLVEIMHGEIHVKSAVGEGTTITVSLPQGNAGAEAIGREQADNLQKFSFHGKSLVKGAGIIREYMPYGSVLIVDDVETNLYVARGFLAPYGLTIDTALSGFEAIEKVKGGSEYDVIFMDHMMPKMDGIEATRILREMGYMRPIVALTANALVGHAAMFLSNGFDDYISKPIDIRQLNATLNMLIRDRKPPEMVDAARRKKEEEQAGADTPKEPVDTLLAELFQSDAEKAVAVLEAIHNNGYSRGDDIHAFIITVHGMKSALSNIGEPELSRSALTLENAGRAGNTALIAKEMPAFLSALRAVMEKYKGKDESEETEDEDAAYLRVKLLVIYEACKAYDRQTAKDTLRELSQKRWSRHTKEQLKAISEHLLRGDFEEAAGIAEGDTDTH